MTQAWGDPAEPERWRPGRLARQERSDDFWLRAIRRKPMIAVLSVVAVVAPFGLVVVVPDTGIWHYTALVVWALVAKQALGAAKERLTRELEVADETSEADGARRPIDVRSAEPVMPSLDRGTPARDAMNGATVLAAVLAVAGTGLACWVGLVVDDAVPIAVLLGGLGALAATGVVLLPLDFRRRLAYVASRPGPAPVRVVGHRPHEGRWVLAPLKGEGEVGEVTLTGGGEHLVAGDVLHAWGDVLVDENLPARKRKLALTGPFGTLLASRVADSRSVEVRISLDRDARDSA